MNKEMVFHPVMVLFGIMILIVLVISCAVIICISPLIFLYGCVLYLKDFISNRKISENLEIKDFETCLDNTKTEYSD